jgi:hypothetical protein
MKMTYAIWMKDTAVFGRVRSKELRAVDEALKTYEQAEKNSTGSILNEKRALKDALTTWEKAKGPGIEWMSNARNDRKAVAKLHTELGMVMVGAGGLNSRGELMMDPAEVKARKIVADAIKSNTKTMFLGRKLTAKNSKSLADTYSVSSAMNNFKTAAQGVRSAAQGVVQPNLQQQVQSLLVSLFGQAGAAQAQQALGPVFNQFLVNVTPFVGCISSGGQAIVKWAQAAAGLYKKSQIAEGSLSFAPGDPYAAFEAIVQIQQREINAYASEASVRTVSAVAKGAFTALDFGTVSGAAVGAAESLAILVQTIYLFARDWKEMNAVNVLLGAGTYDLSLFKTCPLLGCYLISCSDTSAVIDLAVGDYGKAGWKFEVEAMVKKAKPAFEKAAAVVQGSRFEIVELRGYKGTKVNRNDKTLGIIPTGKIDGFIEDVTNKIDKTEVFTV